MAFIQPDIIIDFHGSVQIDLSGEFEIVAVRPSGQQEILAGGDGIFQQPMHDDDIHAGEFHEIEDPVKERFAAVDDNLQLKFFDEGAGVAGAGGGPDQLIQSLN